MSTEETPEVTPNGVGPGSDAELEALVSPPVKKPHLHALDQPGKAVDINAVSQWNPGDPAPEGFRQYDSDGIELDPSPPASAWKWGGVDMTPGGPNDPKVKCHHTADGTDTDEAGHVWNSIEGNCPSQPHAYVPDLPDSEQSPRIALPPVPENHVAVEVDFSLSTGEVIEQALAADKGTWAMGCNLELVQERGPAGGAAVVRLSGPPVNVKAALIRYCGGDVIEAAYLYGPGFSDHTGTVTPGGS